MFHPVVVHNLQHNQVFQFPHDLGADFLFPAGVNVIRQFMQVLADFIPAQVCQFFFLQFPKGCKVLFTVTHQILQVPVFRIGFRRTVHAHGPVHDLVGEFHYSRPQIFLIQHLAAFLVDNFALLVHDVVVLQHHLTDVEVAFFYFLLGIFNGTCNDLVFNGLVFFHAQLVHHALDFVGTEQTHQVVFQGQIEPGRTGIALASATAS